MQTLKQLQAELNRELELRQRVYPKQIIEGKLNTNRAKEQIKNIQMVILLLSLITEDEYKLILKRVGGKSGHSQLNLEL
jgi:hypothetical protein